MSLRSGAADLRWSSLAGRLSGGRRRCEARYLRAREPTLSLLIPGCSVAGDQDPSRFVVGGPMPRSYPDMSSPHLRRGRDLRSSALGKTETGSGWLRV
jgi:hypothetical protein